MKSDRVEGDEQRRWAKIVQGRADSAAQDARKIEESAASDLAVAQPALDAAKDAVNCLDKASVTELKSFAKPPSGVDKVTDALLILVKGAGKKGLGWDPAKKMMAKVCSVLTSLIRLVSGRGGRSRTASDDHDAPRRSTPSCRASWTSTARTSRKIS